MLVGDDNLKFRELLLEHLAGNLVKDVKKLYDERY
jgi:hypothetical protein